MIYNKNRTSYVWKDKITKASEFTEDDLDRMESLVKNYLPLEDRTPWHDMKLKAPKSEIEMAKQILQNHFPERLL